MRNNKKYININNNINKCFNKMIRLVNRLIQ